MSGVDQETLATGAIDDYFLVETKILSTRTADLYIAQDKLRGGDVSLWRLRDPLPLDSSVIAEYLKRQQVLESIDPPVSDYIGYAVDNTGIAFGVLARLDGNTLTEGSPEISELERRFVSCVEIAARIHTASIVCGDLCKNSFWLNRTGSVRFIGIMGAFETDSQQGLASYPEAIEYLAPEQKTNESLDLRSDVYAMGVLGYFIFAGRYHRESDEGSYSKIRKLRKDVPFWADQVIRKALSKDPSQRYQNAIEMLEAIKSQREAYADDPEKAMMKNKQSAFEDGGQKPNTSFSLGKALPTRNPFRFGPGFIKLLIGVGLLVALAIFLRPLYTRYAQTSKLSHALSAHRAIAGQQLSQALDGILSSTATFDQKKEFIDLIMNSDDPVAHAVLVTLGRNSSSLEVRRACENSILERARKASLLRSADVVATWLTDPSIHSNPPGYTEDVLLTLDRTIPPETRSKALRRIYAEHSALALMLTAAFSLDSNNVDEYRSLLSQLLGDRTKGTDLENRSTLALILSSSNLSDNFGSEVIDRRDLIPDQDLLWVLGMLADRDDGQVKYLAESVIKRGIVSEERNYFLSLVKDRPDLPSEVLRSLVRASLGKIKAEDVGSFGRWYDNSIEEILLRLSATETDPDVLYEVFDTLASRSILNTSAASLVDWVKNNYWETRLEFIKSIGVLSLGDKSNISDIQSALSVFDRYIVDKELLSALLDTESSKIGAIVIERYKEVIPPANLLLLLGDPDREVRLATIKALAKSNDVGALRIIIESYEKELDPVVKKAYADQFWVIKRRLER